MSLAPHKFHGPKGVGILFIREGIDIEPALTGGGQESGQRPGTVNVPFAVGAAKSFELAMAKVDENVAHCRAVRDHLVQSILAKIPEGCVFTGDPTDRLPHHASFAFEISVATT
mgnify:CR=1 FL=1